MSEVRTDVGSPIAAGIDSDGPTHRMPRMPRMPNGTDASRGQPLIERVLRRQRELEVALASLPLTARSAREDLDLALATIAPMLTGDLERIPDVVSVGMSRWLERNKHLAETVHAEVEQTQPFPLPGDLE